MNPIKEWMNSLSDIGHLEMASKLNNAGFRVCQAIPPFQERMTFPALPFRQPDDPTLLVSIIDFETTGFAGDPAAEIIEIGLLKLRVDAKSGFPISVEHRYNAFQQPSNPIPEAITRLTGITNEDVQGQSIDWEHVVDVAKSSDYINAHNGEFDFHFLFRARPDLIGIKTLCSYTNAQWGDEGCTSSKLDYVGFIKGATHEGHRAINDCEMTAFILACPISDKPNLSMLRKVMDSAITPRWHIWAVDLPFDSKDEAKKEGYRWSDGSDGRPKAWNKIVTPEDFEHEIQFLANLKSKKPICELREITTMYSPNPVDRINISEAIEFNRDLLEAMQERVEAQESDNTEIELKLKERMARMANQPAIHEDLAGITKRTIPRRR